MNLIKCKISVFISILCATAAASAWAGEPPKRLISLMPSNTELVFDLGAGANLVGVTSFCDYPAETKKIEKVGDFIHPNFEKMIALKPDLVLAGQWQSTPIVQRLKKAGIPVLEVKLPSTLEEIQETFLEIGNAIGRGNEAQALAANFKERIQKIAATDQIGAEKLKIFIYIDDPNWTVSRLSFISDAVERCGAVNIFRDLSVAGAQVSIEALLSRNPDFMIISKKKLKANLSRTGWSQIKAVKNGNIIDTIPENSLARPTPRILDAMELIAKKIQLYKKNELK